jgi:hypothetical protein
MIKEIAGTMGNGVDDEIPGTSAVWLSRRNGSGLNDYRVRLEVESQHKVHWCRLAKKRAGDELGLLRGCGRGINENRISKFRSDISRLSVFQYADDQPNLAMAPMTGLTVTAVRSGQTDQSRRRDRGSLCLHR